MLIDFTVKNYQSIRDAQTFSFVSESKTEDKNVLFSMENNTINLYPFSVIFGPNASGKSKFLYALEDLCNFVKESYRYSEKDNIVAYKPFLLDSQCKDMPTCFELEYEVNGKRYLYILEISKTEVLREELYLFSYNKKSSKSKVFIRKKGDALSFGTTFSGSKKALESFLLINQSLLSRSGNSNNDSLKEAYSFFEDYVKFYTKRNLMSSRFSLTTYYLAKSQDKDFKSIIIELLKTADIQIEDIKIEYRNNFEKENDVQEENIELDSKFDEIIKLLINSKPKTAHKVYNCDDNELIYFDLKEQESTGTIKLYDLAMHILLSLSEGTLLVIDEFNNGLHPLIEKMIIDLYLNPEINKKNAQLLITSHDTYILDTCKLKREQIWFTDKNEEGVTELYSLNEFDKNVIRDYANYGKSYFDGRFKALPKVSEFSLE
ncbi:MAG: ATP-binding protein [Treponemataceae bacterium]|nr:ATP-binding protein [Treponemataceae bacterium]